MSLSLSMALSEPKRPSLFSLSLPSIDDIIPNNIPMFSMVKVNPDYTGDCVRLKKRDKDGITSVQSFGFDAQGYLDRQAIADWAKGSPLWLEEAYRQENGATGVRPSSTDPRRQPRFHLNDEFGKPCIEFKERGGNKNSWGQFNLGINGKANFSVVAFVRQQSGSRLLSWDANSGFLPLNGVGTGQIYISGGATTNYNTGLVANEYASFVTTFEGGSAAGLKTYKDGVLIDTADMSAVPNLIQEFGTNAQMGYFTFFTESGGSGFFRELIFADETLTQAQVDQIKAYHDAKYAGDWPSYTPFADPIYTITTALPFISHYGANFAEAEFSTRDSHAVLGWDYSFSGYWKTTTSHAAYYADRGAGIIRYPITLDRMQSRSFGELNQSEHDMVYEAALRSSEQGMRFIIDYHNYIRRYDYRTYQTEIWYADQFHDEIYDFYYRQGNAWKGCDNVEICIMNEPYGVTAVQARDMNLVALTALRAAGFTGRVHLSGTGYTGMHSWVTGGNAAAYDEWITGGTITVDGNTMISFANSGADSDNLVFDMHQYPDSNNSGTNAACVASAVTRPDDAIAWARAHQVNGFNVLIHVGEYGFSSDASCKSVADVMLDKFFLSATDVIDGNTAWGGGAFGNDYIYKLDLVNGTEPHFMRLLVPYLKGFFASDTSATLTIDMELGSTLFQEIDGSNVTPALVGDPVGVIMDANGSGAYLRAFSNDGRAILREDGRGKYLDLDGVDDRYYSVGQAQFTQNDSSLFSKFQLDDVDSAQYLFNGISGSSARWGARYDTTNTQAISAQAGGFNEVVLTAPSDSQNYGFTRSGIAIDMYVNGGKISFANGANPSTPNGYRMGYDAEAGGRRYLNGKIYQLHAYNKALTQTEAENMIDYYKYNALPKGQ